MAKIKAISTILFAVLLIGLGHFSSSQPMGHGYGYDPIHEFIHRLQAHIIHDTSVFKFELTTLVLLELGRTTIEFQNLCFGYDRELKNPVKALEKAIEYVFYFYKEQGDEEIMEEIENGDPVGFNVYLREKRIDKYDSDFINRTKIFVPTMRDRIRLEKLKYNLTDIPQDVRYPIATEYAGLKSEPINYFINFAAKQTKKKMYPINLVEMNEFNTYKKKKVDDVQIFGATYYDPMNAMIPGLHALCINYKASTKMVHVYDSGNSGYLEGRQRGIIQKLYPDHDIKFEKSTALQNQNTTCALFAITYATMLLLGRDPAIDSIKVNEVHGDETLYMRLHIMDMLSKEKLFLPKQWGFK